MSKTDTFMPKSKVSSGLVTRPPNVVIEELDLEVGDYIRYKPTDDGVLIEKADKE